MSGDELELVRWIQSQCPSCDDVVIGIGDDMAAVATTASQVLVSSDQCLEGVHFDLSSHGLRGVGRKAVARCLSDCAAMAVRPRAVVVSLALPHAMSTPMAREVFHGILAAANEFEVPLVGGDIARWSHPLAIDVTVIAEPYAAIQPIPRSGARTDDVILVSGPLGGSILGRHMHFAPRIAEARRIAERLRGDLHSMIDISDGLSLDLSRLCEASGVGAILDERMLESVISDDARRAAELDGRSATEHALHDGEDYELLLTVDPQAALDDLSLFPIGHIVDQGFFMRHADGHIVPLNAGGFVH